jgi:hypothetical protein
MRGDRMPLANRSKDVVEDSPFYTSLARRSTLMSRIQIKGHAMICDHVSSAGEQEAASTSFVQLFDGGFRDVIPVIPPHGHLAANSTLAPENRGKTPGRKGTDGRWRGFGGWPKHVTTRSDCLEWDTWGANIGLRCSRYPTVDIDVHDRQIAESISDFAALVFGQSLTRVGLAPKRAHPYRSEEPISGFQIRFRLEDGSDHLCELLGVGRHVVVVGVHATTRQPYRYIGPAISQVVAAALPSITIDLVSWFREDLVRYLQSIGATVIATRTAAAKSHPRSSEPLRAADLEAFVQIAKQLPNDGRFDNRSDWIALAHALAAAIPEDPSHARRIFLDHSERWHKGPTDGEASRVWDSIESDDHHAGAAWVIDKARSAGIDTTAYDNAVNDLKYSQAADEFSSDMDG